MVPPSQWRISRTPHLAGRVPTKHAKQCQRTLARQRQRILEGRCQRQSWATGGSKSSLTFPRKREFAPFVFLVASVVPYSGRPCRRQRGRGNHNGHHRKRRRAAAGAREHGDGAPRNVGRSATKKRARIWFSRARCNNGPCSRWWCWWCWWCWCAAQTRGRLHGASKNTPTGVASCLWGLESPCVPLQI